MAGISHHALTKETAYVLSKSIIIFDGGLDEFRKERTSPILPVSFEKPSPILRSVERSG